MSPSPLSPTPSPLSFVIREFCKQMLLDEVVGFNALIELTSQSYGVRPAKLQLAGNPPTLFLGRYDLPTLQRVIGANNIGTYAVLSVGKVMGIGSTNMRVTPSVFSGGVPISLDFYTITDNGSLPPDGEAQFFALEEAVINSFNGMGGAVMVPPGVSYNNEIDADPGRMEWDGTRFIQVVSFTLLFNRVAYGY